MPECPTEHRLKEFLDGRLSPRETTETSDHLENCTECQALCDQLTAVSADPLQSAVRRLSLPDKVLVQLLQSPPDSHSIAATAERSERQATGSARIGQRLGPYLLKEQIASGAQGILYRASDETLRRDVAVKILHTSLMSSESARLRFLREARLGASLRNPHVVQVLQVETNSEPPYLVMEFVTGQSLKEMMDHARPLPASEAVRILRESALGLEAAHRTGMIHRDIKPSNILLDHEGCARLTDFGLAVDDAAVSRMTLDGTIVGTPAYMSPEQILNPRRIDARADLYSLGVVFYEMLTGEIPFRGSVRMTLMQITHEEPRPLRVYDESIPRDIETICLRLLAKTPGQRFASARELIDELDRWSSGRPIHSRPISGLERARRWCRRNPAISGLIGVTTLLILGIMMVLSWSSWKLAESNRTTQQLADTAASQRNAALETLRSLVFQLQEGFDDDDIDLDELQKQSLQIALEGLRQIRITESAGAPQNLATAEALRRMGELLSRLGNDEEAFEYLRQAETSLRSWLKDQPEDLTAIAALVETLWLLDETDESGDPDHIDTSRLAEATQLARQRRKLDSSEAAARMLAEALLNEGTALYDSESESGQTALERLSECLDVCQPLLSDSSTTASDVRAIWADAVETRYACLVDSASAEQSEAFLVKSIEQSEQLLAVDPRNLSLMVTRLSLQDRLICEREIQGKPEIEKDLDSLKLMTKLIAETARADATDFLVIMETLQTVADERAYEEDSRSLRRIIESSVEISSERVRVAPKDDYALCSLAELSTELGELQAELDASPEEAEKTLAQAVSLFREADKRNALDVTNHESWIDALLAQAEISQILSKPEWKLLTADAADQLEALRKNFPDDLDTDWVHDTRQRIRELRQSRETQ